MSGNDVSSGFWAGGADALETALDRREAELLCGIDPRSAKADRQEGARLEAERLEELRSLRELRRQIPDLFF